MLFRLLCGLFPDWNAFLRAGISLKGKKKEGGAEKLFGQAKHGGEALGKEKREGGGEGCYVDVAAADPRLSASLPLLLLSFPLS